MQVVCLGEMALGDEGAGVVVAFCMTRTYSEEDDGWIVVFEFAVLGLLSL